MRLIHNYVAIIADEVPEVTTSGIITPKTLMAEPDRVSATGTVYAVPEKGWSMKNALTTGGDRKGVKIDWDRSDGSGLNIAEVSMPNELSPGDRISFKHNILPNAEERGRLLIIDGQKIHLIHYSEVVCRFVDGLPEAIGDNIICKELVEEFKSTASGIITSAFPDVVVGKALVHSIGHDWDRVAPALKKGDTILYTQQMNIEVVVPGEVGWIRVPIRNLVATIPDGITAEDILRRREEKEDFEKKVKEFGKGRGWV